MAKTLVTHINPHLDDIAAIWLFKKFHSEFEKAKVEFLSAGKSNELAGTETEDKIYFGIGKGRFDEHKGDLEDCAATLVWKDIKNKKHAPKDEVELAALEELVEWIRLVDLGRTPIQQYDEFTLPAFIRPYDGKVGSSREAVDLGSKILDRILEVLKNKHKSLKDWEGRIEFKNRFGRSFAVESDSINRSFCKAQGIGELFVIYSPQKKAVEYFTPSFEIDLEPIYQKAKELDPAGSWFLHHSHHMVLCGSGSAPDSKPTKLSFKELVDIAKSA